MKKLVFAIMMAMMLGSVVNTATADAPWPSCFPCDESVVSGN